ncbi:MAG: hypothetical protein AB8G96_06090 [Phycisphaerales bacterium]
MPDAPDRSTLMHMLLEDPWLILAVLAIAAIVFLWRAVTGAGRREALIGVVLLAVAGGIYGLARLVVTPAEHGEATVRQFIELAGAGDVPGVDGIMSSDATLHRVRESNIGADRAIVLAGVATVPRYNVVGTRITSIESYPDGEGGAIVHLGVSALTNDGGNPTRWVIRAGEEAGAWRITKLTWVSFFTGPPPSVPGLR